MVGLRSTSPALIELRDVSKIFRDQRDERHILVLDRFNLVIPRTSAEHFTVIFGPSGCGKSTILNLIAGSIEPDKGVVLVNGVPLTGQNSISATVPQSYTCFPWLTALGNVEFGLAIRGATARERKPMAINYLAKVGLLDRSTAYPRELSGGMQQRVAIARTLAVRPEVVLMDEPFGALDAQTRSEMQQMLLQVTLEERASVIFVTHDINEAVLLADRIVVLSRRPARLLEDLSVPFERPRRPELVRDQRFMAISERLLELLKDSMHERDQVPQSPVDPVS